MPETNTAIVVIEVRYECDTGDGGVLSYDGPPEKDNANEDVFAHRCSNPKDEVIYFFKVKYPRLEQQAVDLDTIKI